MLAESQGDPKGATARLLLNLARASRESTENSVGTRAHPQKNLREVVEKPRGDFVCTIVEVRVNPRGFIGGSCGKRRGP